MLQARKPSSFNVFSERFSIFELAPLANLAPLVQSAEKRPAATEQWDVQHTKATRAFALPWCSYVVFFFFFKCFFESLISGPPTHHLHEFSFPLPQDIVEERQRWPVETWLFQGYAPCAVCFCWICMQAAGRGANLATQSHAVGNPQWIFNPLHVDNGHLLQGPVASAKGARSATAQTRTRRARKLSHGLYLNIVEWL